MKVGHSSVAIMLNDRSSGTEFQDVNDEIIIAVAFPSTLPNLQGLIRYEFWADRLPQRSISPKLDSSARSAVDCRAPQ